VLSDTVRVTVVPPLPKLRLAGSDRICPGSQNVTYRVTNPRAGLTYRWDISGGTLVSGQGSAAVLVNWGAVNPNARLIVRLDNNTCNLGGDTLRVDVNLTLRPPRPFSPVDPDTLCVAQANNVRYALPTATEGSVYQWFTSLGGRVTNGQNSGTITVDWTGVSFPANPPGPFTVRVWATETITTPTNRCFGASDTLLVLLYPSPTANRIVGSVEVCENAPATYSLAGLPGSTYRWTVTGGQVQGAATGSSLTVLWGRSGPGTLIATETSRLNCPGGAVNLAVNINPIPRPQLVLADSVVCRGDASPKRYRVSGQAGSRFRWAITGGRIASFSPDSSQVDVLWDTLVFPKRLTVTETSAPGCASTVPFVVPVYIDGTEIAIRAVTVQLADERNTELRFRIQNAPALPQTFSVERRVRGQGNFGAVGTVLVTDSVFTDRSLDTDANSYEYQIRRTQQTGPCATRTGAAHATIRLQGNITPDRVDLNWGTYQGWSQVARYEVWRRTDGETAFRNIGQVNGGVLTFTSPDGRAGFRQCYRIRAVEAGTGRESWSNEVCADLDFPLVVPNVITPNNDGRNDRFAVPNLELYQQPLLQVFNRYGQKIYESTAYRNDWDGAGYPSGTYFYYLRAIRPGREAQLEYKGWVQVLRE
jgi:gliding motility-associated-like protein